VRITPAGADLLTRAQAATRKAEDRALAFLDEEQQRQLRSVLLYRGDDVDLVRRIAVQGGQPLVQPGSPGSQILPELLPPAARELDAELLLTGDVQTVGPNETVMWKPRWSAFYRTLLGDYLAKLDVSTIVIAGCNFPNCPRTSIFDASARDLRILIATDATSGVTDERLADAFLIGAHAATSAKIALLSEGD
jgi:nicotinamidase-related amidase